MSTEEFQTNGRNETAMGQEFSLALIMFHQSAAEKVGLNLTDYKVLGIIPPEGTPAGKIAAMTGLSTGMVTTVVDRLEQKGYVYRENDPKDRRKVIIKPNFQKVGASLGPIFQSFGQAMGKVMSGYTPDEIRVIQDYIAKSTEVFKQETQKLKQRKSTRDADTQL